MTLRRQVSAMIGANSTGTVTRPFAPGYNIKQKINVNYDVEQDVAKISSVCNALVAAGMDAGIVGRLFKWKCELSTGEYNKLSDAHRVIADAIITAKPGTPDIKIVEVKS